MQGDAEPFARMIDHHAAELPEHVRLFVADLARGKAKRQAGAPRKYTGAEERAILCDVFTQWERFKQERNPSRGGGPRVLAIAAVADDWGLSEGAVTGVVQEAIGAGLTLELWVRMGRPNWGATK